MNYAIIGGDMRFAHLARLLEESGRNTVGFFQEKAGGGIHAPEELRKYSAVISNWPMRFPLTDTAAAQAEVMSQIVPGSTLLLCGPKFPGEKRWDLQYVNLWADETLLTENAWLTAEGAVAAAMHASGVSLRGARCAVIGFGRIGYALTEILLNLCAEVRVVSGSPEKRAHIRGIGAEAFEADAIETAIRGCSFVFSTAPAPVIGRDELKCADADVRIIDLASPPYGVDLDAAQDLNLQAWREPGLPGRYCPLSAARALYSAVIRWEEAETHGES